MESVKPANVVLQIVDAKLNADERDRMVQTFWDDLTALDLVDRTDVTFLIDPAHEEHQRGLQARLKQPETVTIWLEDMSDRLEATPVEIRLTCTIDRMRVQIQTASNEELLGVLPAINAILPAQQIFQAQARTYAHRNGEISPVEATNLDLLRHRLKLNEATAQTMIDEALGPYHGRQDKLNKYREVLNAELERQQPEPLSQTTWAELGELRRSLGLSPKDVEPINQEYIARLQTEQARQQEQAEQTRLQIETELQQEEEQRQIATQEDHAEQYRQEFAKAIVNTLYPTVFDQGRLEQARRDWQLDAERARAIEREVTDERYGPVDTAHELDYTRLRDLLWRHQWEAADQETERLILTALSQDMRPLEGNAIIKLNCIDLDTIDNLWSRYSREKFGFRAQHRVFAEQEREADGFLSTVGWKEGLGLGNILLLSRGRPYRDLQFNLEAPTGHLPTWRWAADALQGEYVVDEDIVYNVFLDLVEKCVPELKAPPPSSREGGLELP